MANQPVSGQSNIQAWLQSEENGSSQEKAENPFISDQQKNDKILEHVQVIQSNTPTPNEEKARNSANNPALQYFTQYRYDTGLETIAKIALCFFNACFGCIPLLVAAAWDSKYGATRTKEDDVEFHFDQISDIISTEVPVAKIQKQFEATFENSENFKLDVTAKQRKDWKGKIVTMTYTFTASNSPAGDIKATTMAMVVVFDFKTDTMESQLFEQIIEPVIIDSQFPVESTESEDETQTMSFLETYTSGDETDDLWQVEDSGSDQGVFFYA